jgi:hypothetical protein
VILQAYDFPNLRQGHGRKLLWTAHLSIRAAGTNFARALPRMGRIASDLYGQNSVNVVTGKYLDEKKTEVEIGPITILGMALAKK